MPTIQLQQQQYIRQLVIITLIRLVLLEILARENRHLSDS
ncbi:hypothetical protein DICVIV_11535 [Dictyocaulus viviparus]|uniref:Uncharacterized protein n=1 Tax=Dictyocaulus viviparus TaxID=29172 RepID=A0A0D8XFG7_DICVI|nr:hypothetical protein DICVIV_11535 [Dictyocaulus viviparus]